MPITPFLNDEVFDPEHVKAMGVAFQKVCERLRLSNADDLATQTVAGKIIMLARTGERDPMKLYRAAMLEFHGPRYDDGALVAAEKSPAAPQAPGDGLART
jgi:hypothetical protein